MSEIDDFILHLGTIIAHEFTTKPVEVALDTTRQVRAQLHETEQFKVEYEAKMRELMPSRFTQFPVVGFNKLKVNHPPPMTDKDAIKAALTQADGSGIDWPYGEPAPRGWNRATNEERERMINKYGLDDPILDSDKLSEEQVHEMLREMGMDPVELGKRGEAFVQDLLIKQGKICAECRRPTTKEVQSSCCNPECDGEWGTGCWHCHHWQNHPAYAKHGDNFSNWKPYKGYIK